MTKLKFIFVSILIAFLNLNVHAQGVKIYKSDKEVITIPYSELDSIVAYDSKQKPDVIEWVDLGLPSGVKWASHNVGATKPEEYGGYFAWGELMQKTVYTYETYKFAIWGEDENGEKTIIGSSYLGDISGDAQYDVAAAQWGGGARMPTTTEMDELAKECKGVYSELNGVAGCLVTGPNGNSIFLPFTGIFGETLEGLGVRSAYWSSTLYEDKGKSYHHAYELYINSAGNLRSNGMWSRYLGRPIRPVHN